MTTTVTTFSPKKTALFAAMGMGLLALPLAMPSTAQADDFKIHLNLGGWGAPSYYAPAPQRVVYREVAPRRVVYVSRPVYREKVVYRDYRGHPGRGHGHWKHGRDRWDNDRRTAWR